MGKEDNRDFEGSFWFGLMFSLCRGHLFQMACLWCNSYGERKVFMYDLLYNGNVRRNKISRRISRGLKKNNYM